MKYKNYDSVACVYDDTRKIPEESVLYFKEKIHSYLKNKYSLSNYRILAIGAGTGRIESSLATSEYCLFGIDISQKMLTEFQKKNLPSCYQIQADGLFLPFAKNFHLVTAVHFIHLINEYERFLDEVSNISNNLMIGDAYINTLDNPYYLKFRELLVENNWEEPKFDDTRLTDFYQFMTDLGYEPKVYESKTDTEIRSIDIFTSLQNRYYGSMWDIDDKIFEKTKQDFKEYFLTNKEIIGETYPTYSFTKLFFYELD